MTKDNQKTELARYKNLLSGQRTAINSMRKTLAKNDAKMRKFKAVMWDLRKLGELSATQMAERFGEVVKAIKRTKELYEGEWHE